MNDDLVYETISYQWLDDFSFDDWREQFDIFEMKHSDCIVSLCWDDSDGGRYITFQGYRFKTDVEIAKELVALREAEKIRLRQKKEAEEEAERIIEKNRLRREMESDPGYKEYQDFKKRYKDW